MIIDDNYASPCHQAHPVHIVDSLVGVIASFFDDRDQVMACPMCSKRFPQSKALPRCWNCGHIPFDSRNDDECPACHCYRDPVVRDMWHLAGA